MDEKLLARLRCPISHRSLVLADQALLDQINAGIGNQQIENRTGTVLDAKIESATTDEDGEFLFIIEKNVVNLIPDDAINLDQLNR